MLRLLSVPPGFNCFIYFMLQYSGDDSWISTGPFMQPKHLCVLIHYIINDEVGTVKLVKALKQFSYLPFQGSVSCVDLFCYLLFCLSLPILNVCLLQPCGHQLGKS